MERPNNPSSDFPLFAHANGRGMKKTQGKLHYFDAWEKPQMAEEDYRRQKPELENNGRAKHKQSKRRREKLKTPSPDYLLYHHSGG